MLTLIIKIVKNFLYFKFGFDKEMLVMASSLYAGMGGMGGIGNMKEGMGGMEEGIGEMHWLHGWHV